MFSYFKKGITDTTPSKIIDLPQLVKTIQNNPERILIEHIRILKKEGNGEIKELKRKLPNITPNCIVKYRKLESEEDFNNNFISSSHYIYFDTDDIQNIEEYKEYFIKQYGNLVSLVSKSSSCGGLSILFKLTNAITSKEQFFQVWDTIRTTILKNEKIDLNCKDIDRAMFISYDPDVYFNYENEITVDINYSTPNTNIEKGITQPISRRGGNYILSDTFFQIISIDEVFKKIILKTKVEYLNPVVDVKPLDYSEVTFHKKIKDGHKRNIYTAMIHNLVFLNPDLKPDYIFTYINFINNNYATPKMIFEDLVRLFRSVYSGIKNNSEYNFKNSRIKRVHTNPKSGLTGEKRRTIASKINGKMKSNRSIIKILEAREFLNSQGLKVTANKISELTGISLTTVKRHYRKESPIDIDQMVADINSSFIEPSTTGIDFKESFRGVGTNPSAMNIYPPECPRLEYQYQTLKSTG